MIGIDVIRHHPSIYFRRMSHRLACRKVEHQSGAKNLLGKSVDLPFEALRADPVRGRGAGNITDVFFYRDPFA